MIPILMDTSSLPQTNDYVNKLLIVCRHFFFFFEMEFHTPQAVLEFTVYLKPTFPVVPSAGISGTHHHTLLWLLFVFLYLFLRQCIIWSKLA